MDTIAHVPDLWTAARVGALLFGFFFVAIVLPSLAFCAFGPRFLAEPPEPPC